MNKQLQPHESRVVVERDDLDDKVGKLDVFIHSDHFEKVGKRSQELLTVQLGAMREYLSILDQRIELFGVEE